MSLGWQHGDIWQDIATAICIPVNCVGVMGRGLALQLKERYPSVYKSYRAACHDGTMGPGDVMRFPMSSNRYVYCVATKDHYSKPSRLEWIESGLNHLNYRIHADGFPTTALPALGCGNGELSWSDVRPLVELYMDIDDVDVRCYLPMEAK